MPHVGVLRTRLGCTFLVMVLATSNLRLLVFPVAVLVVVACSPVGTKGTMPPPGPNGERDLSAAPDFIAVVAGDRDEVGYVPKRFFFREGMTSSELPRSDPWPVYAEDLRTLIGHMVQGKGFVPLGVNPATIPEFPVRVGPSSEPAGPPTWTVYVRNALGATIWFASVADGKIVAAGGVQRGIGAECISSPPGARLIIADRPPEVAGVKARREIKVPGNLGEGTTVWIDVDTQGTITEGQGIPGWWPDPPLGC